ncbi:MULTISPECIES: hypothetical protein [Megasphaera]|uniref:Phage gp6-like head-tail connector protein n=1 Tax=Megasphaera vaginalis (ex Srinivasan et al. 2021) TaxID=1111454 RepID=U7UPL1_9FIRM|nr:MULTISPECIES: hypothetical protein [Megasphaera]ERT61250.1 hypothetical protein HMPREF1250_0173 [Megasphaera vaginalis (ex Srinivasan et al. 2021)]
MEQMDKIKALIKMATGIDIGDSYDGLIEYIYNNERQHILNDCNLTEIPDGLAYVVEERTAARFMQANKSIILNDADLNVVTSIREGDTTVNFGDANAETRLDNVIGAWLRSRERDIACYRKLRW